MFKTVTEPFGSCHIVTLINLDTGESLSIIPECGAKVYEIVLKKDGKLISLLDNDKDPETVVNDKWHKGEFLIPFPNRIKGGEYEFLGNKYNLDINMPHEGNAIHGIMYNKCFSLLQSTENNTLIFEYEYNGDTSGYPFPCVVRYTFTLLPQTFSCEISVKNIGAKELPLGVGWHPYFTLGTDVNDLELQMPESRSIDVDETMIPTGEKSPFNEYNTFSQIHDTGFDTGFEILKKNNLAVTSILNPLNNTTIELRQNATQNGFGYLQVFTPPGRKTIALEPMTCPANAFNSKESLILLDANQLWRGTFEVCLK